MYKQCKYIHVPLQSANVDAVIFTSYDKLTKFMNFPKRWKMTTIAMFQYKIIHNILTTNNNNLYYYIQFLIFLWLMEWKKKLFNT